VFLLGFAPVAGAEPGARGVPAGPIWNQQDAELKCPVAAVAVGGRWTGHWRTTVEGQMSECDVADIAPRDVRAGPIWNQQDAELKCPVVATAVRGRWTGHWTTTEWGQMSVCQIEGL
jgi:rubredoxin